MKKSFGWREILGLLVTNKFDTEKIKVTLQMISYSKNIATYES